MSKNVTYDVGKRVRVGWGGRNRWWKMGLNGFGEGVLSRVLCSFMYTLH